MSGLTLDQLALLGGIAGGLLNLVAFRLGLWHYAPTHPAYAPPWFSVTAGLGYGAVASLLGWRASLLWACEQQSASSASRYERPMQIET